jgi:ABC-type phosphate transport system substrate-binding protein
MRLVSGRSWIHGVVARFIFILVIFSYLMEGSFAQEVVVNPSVSETKLSRSALRAIFSMRLRTWPDGSLIRVFVLENRSSLHAQFSKKILNIFPYQLQRTWDRLVYSGTGQAPIEVKSIEEMHDKVASTPGAIGYLPDKSIDSQVCEVQVVPTQ